MDMRDLIKLLFIVLLALLVIPSCVKEGPPGIDGIDGADGANGANGSDGANGADGVAFCMDCHNNATVTSFEEQWIASGHGSGWTLSSFGSWGDCAQCHSGVGFMASLTEGADLSGSPIGCVSCHTHGEDTPVFQDDDGNAVFLRTKEAVALLVDPTRIIDLESNANLCVNCHQPRTAAPADLDQFDDDILIDPAGDGMYTITSSHYGPHHSPQSALLEGWGGFEFSGSLTYPGTKAHPHRTSTDCVGCHMDEKNHMFTVPAIAACTSCHGGATDYNINGKITEVHALMEELAVILEGEGILHDGHVVTGTYPIDVVAGYYNYIIVEEDQSEGVHNPDYVEALLTNTIESLQ